VCCVCVVVIYRDRMKKKEKEKKGKEEGVQIHYGPAALGKKLHHSSFQ